MQTGFSAMTVIQWRKTKMCDRDETLIDATANKTSICQTCEENEAINDYYGECEGCITDHERNETYKQMMEDYD